jgi:aspartyl-tRNA(Asn)/glutamyl-tRNA(Gln) amidotransferase subunit C
MTDSPRQPSNSEVLDASEVRKIASLARLDVQGEEVESLKGDLNEILAYIEKLNEIQTDDVEPLSHVHGAQNIFRTDESEDSPVREEILKNVPDRSGSFIRVPLIIDQESKA